MRCQFAMSALPIYWIIISIMVVNVCDQSIHQITTCIGNRTWIAPTKRAIGYQNLSIIHPIEVISKSRSADCSYKHQNGVNHGNLSKIVCSDRKPTEAVSLLINARSIRSNGQTIRHHIEHKKPAIAALTETWNTVNNGYFLFADMTLPDTNGVIQTEQNPGVEEWPRSLKCMQKSKLEDNDIEYLWCSMCF